MQLLPKAELRADSHAHASADPPVGMLPFVNKSVPSFPSAFATVTPKIALSRESINQISNRCSIKLVETHKKVIGANTALTAKKY